MTADWELQKNSPGGMEGAALAELHQYLCDSYVGFHRASLQAGAGTGIGLRLDLDSHLVLLGNLINLVTRNIGGIQYSNTYMHAQAGLAHLLGCNIRPNHQRAPGPEPFPSSPLMH